MISITPFNLLTLLILKYLIKILVDMFTLEAMVIKNIIIDMELLENLLLILCLK